MKAFAGHPKGLYVCFATELWERFSYYGMRALLIFYLTQHFLFTDAESYAIYGAYTALAWGLPVIGGVMADRYLGQRRAVLIGALLLSTGHLLLAVEGPAAMKVVREGAVVIERSTAHLQLFFFSLALIATGVGFLKTSISTLVGALYGPEDPRRDAGFTIFYLGINLGSTLSPLLCGWLGQRYGWSYGFGLAGIGMLVGLFTFLKGRQWLEAHGLPPARALKKGRGSVPRRWLPGAVIVAMVLGTWLALLHPGEVGWLLAVGSAALVLAIFQLGMSGCTPIERDRLVVVVLLFAFSAFFWSLYEQSGSSLNLFADRLLDRHLFGIEIEASQLQAVPAMLVLALAPLFSLLWGRLAVSGRLPSAPVQFSAGLLAIAIAFAMPALGAQWAGANGKIGLIWLFLLMFFMVCGELCISPIAMSMVTRLCPQKAVGMMMGAYLLSLSIGSYLASGLAALIPIEQGVTDGARLTAAYTSTYATFAVTATVAAAILWGLSPILHRRMHERASPSCALMNHTSRG